MAVSVAIYVIRDSAVLCRYYVLTLASVNRFYEVWTLLNYETFRIANNIELLAFFARILAALIAITRFLAFLYKICLAPDLGTQYIPKLLDYSSVIEGLLTHEMLPSSAGLVVLLTRVGRELKRMRQRNTVTSDD